MAGRPRKSTKQSLAALMGIPEVEAAIQARLPVLIQRMFDIAEGALVQDVQIDPVTGEPVQRIYRTLPDRQALQFLIENSIGKVPNRVELTGKGGKPVEIVPWAPVAVALEYGPVIDGEVKELTDGSS